MKPRRPGIGPISPRAIFICEAFGEEEEDAGVPLVGKAGRLFDNLIKQAGLRREECYLTNLINERPRPGSNDISPYFANGKLTRLGREAQQGLLQELSGIDCKLVFPMGNTALAALCDVDVGEEQRPQWDGEQPDGITKWRGSPLASPHLPGRLVVPTLHPSYIQRGAWAEAWLVVRDVEKGLRIAQHGPRKYTVQVAQTAEECLTIIAQAGQQKLVVSDIETPNQRLECFTLCWQEHHSFVLPIGTRWAAPERRKVIQAYKRLLEGENGPKLLWQNGNYDTSWLERYEGISTNLARCEDSMYLHHCLYPQIKKKLAVLNSLYTDLPYYKDDYEESKRLSSLELLYDYCGKDGLAPLAAWNELATHEDRGVIERTYRALTMENLPAIQHMQRCGLRVDHRAWAELKHNAQEEIKPLQERLDEMTEGWRRGKVQEAEGKMQLAAQLAAAEKASLAEQRKALKQADKKAEVRHLLSSDLLKHLNAQKADFKAAMRYWQQDFGVGSGMVAALFMERYGERPGSFDKTRLKEFAKPTAKRDLYPEARLILDIRERQKQLDTFLAAQLDPEDLRFKFSLNVRGTMYGRLSGSKLFFRYGGNPLNLPHTFRRVFIADKEDEEWIPFFINLDQSKAEYVHTAYLSGDTNMIQAVESGKDVHAWTAHLLTGVPLGLIEAEAKLIGEATSTAFIAEQRSKLLQAHPEWNTPEVLAAFALVPDSSLRQFGKKRNHAWNYLESAEGYAQRTGTAIRVAREQDRLQRQAFPGVVGYWEQTRWEVINRRRLVNCFGRVIPFRSFFTKEVWKSACAARPQSGVADANNAAMRRVQAWADPHCDVRNNVYDSLLLQFRLSRTAPLADEAARILALANRVAQEMSPELEYGGRRFRVGIDGKIGRCWGKQEKMDLRSVDKLVPQLERIKSGEL